MPRKANKLIERESIVDETSAELINFFVLDGVDALDGSMGGEKQFVGSRGRNCGLCHR